MQRVFLVSIALFALAAVPLFAFNSDDLNEITILNSTGYTLMTVVLSPADSDSWGPEILGQDNPLEDGESITYYLSYPQDSFDYKIMAQDEEGTEYQVDGSTSSEDDSATVEITEGDTVDTASDYTLVKVSVTNKTGREIDHLFLSPADSDASGVDVLGEDTTLDDGDTFVIAVPGHEGAVDYNLMAIDSHDGEYDEDVTVDPKSSTPVAVSVTP